MSKMQRTKGKVYERAVSAILRGFGHACRRGVQYQGSTDSPDVVGIPGVHIEAKHHAKLNVHAAMKQAMADAGENVPVVVHRVNRGVDCITIRLCDLAVFLDKWDESVKAARLAAVTDKDGFISGGKSPA